MSRHQTKKPNQKQKQRKEMRSQRLKARKQRRKEAADFHTRLRQDAEIQLSPEELVEIEESKSKDFVEPALPGAAVARPEFPIRMDSHQNRNSNQRKKKAVLRFGSTRVEVNADGGRSRGSLPVGGSAHSSSRNPSSGGSSRSGGRSGPSSERPSAPTGQGRWKRPTSTGPTPSGSRNTPPPPLARPTSSSFRKTESGDQGLIQGRIDIHPDGFGFVVPKDPSFPNVYIPEESLKYCMHRDTVLVRIEPSNNPNFKARGTVVQVVSRQQKEFFGALRLYKGGALVVPLEARDRRHAFKVQNPPPGLSDMKSGTPVVARIVQYPEVAQGLVEIESIVEEPNSASNDTLRVLLGTGWPREFSKAAKDEAESRAQDWTDKKLPHTSNTRKDIRHLPLVTIDGRDARDFDDAVCAEALPGGKHRLWVAIADVSYFVRSGGVLDQEAFERATSVYFPDFVVPMLPEVLSNGVCSLNPNEDRACLVCEMVLTNQGLVEDFDFYEGLMLSKKRLTYEQMQGYIEKEGWALQEMSHLAPSLDALIEVFHKLNKARFARGAIDLDLPEAYVQLNKDGTVKDIQSRARLDAHRLIEECMLVGNECAAAFIDEKFDSGMYRIHEVPDPRKIEDLARFLSLSGLNLGEMLGKGVSPHPGAAPARAKKGKGAGQRKGQAPTERESGNSEFAGYLQDPRDFARLLEGLKAKFEPGDPLARAIQTLVLRSLKQARYGSERLGHFALATLDYTHYTSPIRRYPDLIVHRLIKTALGIGLESGKTRGADVAREALLNELENQARHCSDQERSAMEMERKLVDIKKCRYLEPHLGEEFEAWTQGITEKGIFCQLDGHFVEGLVHAENLARKYKLHFDPDLMAYAGPAKTFLRIGSRVKVQVAAVDVENRRIDFELLEILK